MAQDPYRGLLTPDIWRLAISLMDEHGRDSDMYVCDRIDEVVEKDGTEAEMRWRRVLWAIWELQREIQDRIDLSKQVIGRNAILKPEFIKELSLIPG